jgi:hypothetical protein
VTPGTEGGPGTAGWKDGRTDDEHNLEDLYDPRADDADESWAYKRATQVSLSPIVAPEKERPHLFEIW